MAENDRVTTDIVANDKPLQEGVQRAEKSIKGFASRVVSALKGRLGFGDQAKDADKLAKSMDDVGKKSDKAAREVQASAGRMRSAMSSLFSIGTGLNQWRQLLGIPSIGDMLRDGLRLFTEAEHAHRRLTSAILATGNATGWTIKQLGIMRDNLSGGSLFSKTEIEQAQSSLMVFTNLRGDVFRDALKTAADLATFMGTDLPAAAQKLGQALQDPLAGLDAFADVGVRFTDREKERINQMLARGRGVDVQKMMLSRLQGSVGGSAGDATEGMAGAWSRAMKAIQDNIRQIGAIVAPIVEKIANAIRNIASYLGGLSGEGFQQARGFVNWLWDKLTGFIDGVAQAGIRVAAVVMTIWNKFSEIFQYAYNWVMNLMAAFWNSIVFYARYIADYIKQLINALVRWIGAVAREVGRFISETIRHPIQGAGGFNIPGLNFNPTGPGERLEGYQERRYRERTDELGMEIQTEYTNMRDTWDRGWEDFLRLLTQNDATNNQQKLGRPGKTGKPQFSGEMWKAEWVGLEDMYKRIAQSRASTPDDPQKQLVEHAKRAHLQREEIRHTAKELLKAFTGGAAASGIDPVQAAGMFGVLGATNVGMIFNQ